MPIEISEKTIKHEFIERIGQLSGQDIYKCFQCGTCGGACPMSGQMETMPRRIMRMAQLGMEESVCGFQDQPNLCILSYLHGKLPQGHRSGKSHGGGAASDPEEKHQYDRAFQAGR